MPPSFLGRGFKRWLLEVVVNRGLEVTDADGC